MILTKLGQHANEIMTAAEFLWSRFLIIRQNVNMVTKCNSLLWSAPHRSHAQLDFLLNVGHTNFIYVKFSLKNYVI